MFAVAFLYLCFTGMMFLGSLLLSQNHFPFFVAGARFFIAGVILLAIYISKHKHSTLKQLPQLMCMSFLKYSFCLYTLSAIGFSFGMQYADPVKACFIFVLSPFITSLFLYFLYGEKLSLKKKYGLTIGFFAIIPIILDSGHGQLSDVPWHLSIFGYFAFACAVTSFAYGWILSKDMHKTVHLPSTLITGAAFLVGGGINLLIFILMYGFSIGSMQFTDDFWWLLLLFSILTAVSYNLYSSLLKRYSPTFISFASFLEPAFGLLYASIFLGQTISNAALIALSTLGFGLYLFYQEELRLQ